MPAQGGGTDVVSLQVSLPQMLDLALGTPEVGAVNLNILHNFLHILLHQVNLQSTMVEYRGEDANRIKTMVTSQKPSPKIQLHEYNVIDVTGKKEQIPTSSDTTASVDIYTEAPETTDGSVKDKTVVKKTGGLKQKLRSEDEGEYQTVLFVEPILNGMAPTALGFKRLEDSVNLLQRRFEALEELSTNPELIERLKGKVNDPLTDMWQIINITKRLDASEKGIDKLTTMVQDVVKGTVTSGGDSEDVSQFNERLTNVEENITNIEQAVNNLQVIASMAMSSDAEGSEAVGETSVSAPIVTTTTNQSEVKEGNQQSEGNTQEITEDNNKGGMQRISIGKLLGGIDIAEMHREVTTLKTEMSGMKKFAEELEGKFTQIATDKERPEQHAGESEVEKSETSKEKRVEKPETRKGKQVESTAGLRTYSVNVNLEDRIKTVENQHATHDNALQMASERIEKLEKEVAGLADQIKGVPVTCDSDAKEINELVSKIQGIQADMEKLNQTADHLIDDRENREVHLNALLEQVEILKTIKADKEDLEDALADKADAQVVNRKVSHDQFDAACDDLARGLEDAISKLGKQESIWQQALDEVQNEIESKVDKIEISPLKDFVNSRLKTLQEKLKSVAEMRQEYEAAGTKKLLRDVQCISCDKNVVMKTEETGTLRAEPLPCTVSMKPYLTYELDQVRKQQKRLPHSRNMIQFAAALQEETKKQKAAKPEALMKTPRDHLCNRYCGGSHTVTTPQQRVTRVGHFLRQWGLETMQLTDGMVQGTDGKMYRSRPLTSKPDICGLCCEEGIDDAQPSDRSASAVTAPRKSSEPRRGGGDSRRRSARKISRESSIKDITIEQAHVNNVTELPPTVSQHHAISDPLPIDPLAHTDEVVRYDEDELEYVGET